MTIDAGGVESGLGGFMAFSECFGDAGITRSGDDVLVSATDSPRTGQSHCLKANAIMAAYPKLKAANPFRILRLLPSLLHLESTFLLFSFRSWKRLILSSSHGVRVRVIIPETNNAQVLNKLASKLVLKV